MTIKSRVFGKVFDFGYFRGGFIGVSIDGGAMHQIGELCEQRVLSTYEGRTEEDLENLSRRWYRRQVKAGHISDMGPA